MGDLKTGPLPLPSWQKGEIILVVSAANYLLFPRMRYGNRGGKRGRGAVQRQ